MTLKPRLPGMHLQVADTVQNFNQSAPCVDG